MGVPRSWRGELLGWSCALFFPSFAMSLLHVMSGVVESEELVIVVVMAGLL